MQTEWCFFRTENGYRRVRPPKRRVPLCSHTLFESEYLRIFRKRSVAALGDYPSPRDRKTVKLGTSNETEGDASGFRRSVASRLRPRPRSKGPWPVWTRLKLFRNTSFTYSTHVSDDSSTTLPSPQLISLGCPCTQEMSRCESPGRANLGYGSNLADTECGSTLSGQLNPIMSAEARNKRFSAVV